MRWIFPIIAVLALARCGGMTDYSADSGSPSSLTGNQGGAGVQAPLWSDDPNKKTMLNQKASSQ